MPDHPNKHIREAIECADRPVSTHEFTLVLAGVSEMTDELAEALYEAGCDDGSPFSSQGVAAIGFSRDAPSMEEAIRSAIANIQRAGVTVVRVEPADQPVLSRINAELTAPQ